MGHIEDPDWAIAELDKFIHIADRFGRRHEGSVTSLERRQRHTDFASQLPVVMAIAKRTNTAYLSALSSAGLSAQGAQDAATMLKTEIQRAREIQERLGPSGPKIAAEGLHPWVWHAASTFWASSHYRQAVAQAAESVNSHLQTKLDRRDVSGAALVGEAFTTKSPRVDAARLRFVDIDRGSEDWESAHTGAVQYGRGCYMAIRNLSTHNTDDMEPQEALERLAALSVLARMIDSADVVEEEQEV